jgi:hypothetical protein
VVVVEVVGVKLDRSEAGGAGGAGGLVAEGWVRHLTIR